MRLFKLYNSALGLFIVANIVFVISCSDDDDPEDLVTTKSALVEPDAEDEVVGKEVVQKTPAEVAQEIDQVVRDLIFADNLYEELKVANPHDSTPPILSNNYPGI